MRRLVVFYGIALAAAVPALAAGGSPWSWALPEIRIVVAHRLMATSVASFRPDDPLTRGDLSDLEEGLTGTVPPPLGEPDAPATMAQLDAGLVKALGLAVPARRFLLAARTAGLAPPARFGNEVVARLLAFRFNHPAATDDLELLPSDPATRAEAAYSAARFLGLDATAVAAVGESSLSFEVPELTPWQQRVLQKAVRFIGYPYVLGGTSESRELPAGGGVPAHVGFDCSGLVWRVYKLQKYPGGAPLPATIRGRTTYQMSGEVPRSERIAFPALEPTDLVFFGDAGPRSKPSQVGHMGIYLGDGWFIHASRQGVYVSALDGWYRAHFAWARRPLAEAGLESP